MRRYSFKPPSGRITRRAGAAVIGGVAALATTGAIVASAAPPQFPDNIVVFPDRDFVSAEGFGDFVGKEITVEVSRGGQLVGSAVATVEEGDHAFEVNHPGGACWGAGTNLKVTPDIRPGDVVGIRYDGDILADTVVQDGHVVDSTLNGSELKVTGHIGSNVDTDQVEQRVVNPDLTTTDVARRDIRAVPGGLTVAPKGGYQSDLAINGNTFTATYQFFTEATARIAANGGGERFMMWQEQDGDGNRQGLTISEAGESGGPGMGGCPAGPADVAPAAGEYGAVRSADKASVNVNWVPASAVPGAAPITGYNVLAIEEGTGTLSGKRTGANATMVSIPGLDPNKNYTYEVRSIADGKLGPAFPLATPDTTPPAPGDVTAPTLTPSTAPGTADAPGQTSNLKVTSNETPTDIYYTTDGSNPLDTEISLPSSTSTLYTSAGIPVSAATQIKWVGFDRAGNASEVGEGYYKAPPVAAPTVAPSALVGTAGQLSGNLRWTHPDATVTYEVELFKDNVSTGIIETTAKSLTVPNLEVGKSYTFTVTAKNAGGRGPTSTRSAPFVPSALTDRVTVTSARWKAGDFRVSGSSSETVSPTKTGFVQVHRVNADGTLGAAITGATANLVPAVAPATGSTFDVRVRAGAPTTNPGRVIVVSSFKGVSAVVTVANG